MTERLFVEQRPFPFLFRKEHAVRIGSIVDSKTEVIVRPAAYLGHFSGGGVERAILTAGGRGIYDEAQAKTEKKQVRDYRFGGHLGDIVVTSSGTIPNRAIKHIIHVVCHGDNDRVDAYAIKTSVKRALREADRLHARSIALPTMGAGVSKKIGVDVAHSLRYTLEGMQQYFVRHPFSSIRHTEVVVYPGDYQDAQQVQHAIDQTYGTVERRRLPRPLPLRLRRS